MYSKEELLSISKIDPELKAHLDANPFPAVPWDDLPALRAGSAAGAERVKELLGATPADLEEPIQNISARDGHVLNHRVVKPKNASGAPLILLIHGGGFIMGHNIVLLPLARSLARLFNAVVVSLQYRFAPEFKFPVPQEDIIDSVKWLGTNAKTLGADPAAGFIVGGSSAGGQLAAVAAQYLADEKFTPKLTGLWQNITVVLAEGIVPEKYKEHWLSRKDPNCLDAPILNSKNVGHVNVLFQPDFNSPLYSPFNSPTAHQGMPKRVYFQVSGMDPLRDDSFIYEAALQEAGVDTKTDVYPGVPHGFNNVFTELKLSTKWRIDFMKGMGYLLGKDVTDEHLKALQAKTEASPATGQGAE